MLANFAFGLFVGHSSVLFWKQNRRARTIRFRNAPDFSPGNHVGAENSKPVFNGNYILANVVCTQFPEVSGNMAKKIGLGIYLMMIEVFQDAWGSQNPA